MTGPEFNDVDRRIRDALRARAEQVTAADLRAADPPSGVSVRRTGWLAPLLAAAAVLALAVGVAVVAAQPNAESGDRPGSTGGPTTSSTSTQSGPSPSDTSASASTSSSVPPNTVSSRCFFSDVPCKGGTVGRDAHYVPLWPFATYAQAQQWRQSGGSQPWHLDAKLTAQYFVQNFLGFHDIGVITSSTITADEAHIGVGFRDPNGAEHTAAVLHLVRYEFATGDTTAPWEIVGSDDTTFSIEKPTYATTVASPMSIGGHISGTDENIRAWVRTLDGVAGTACCRPAGGDNTAWAVKVFFTAPADAALTLVASTGGHLQEHERFAIHGVYAGA